MGLVFGLAETNRTFLFSGVNVNILVYGIFICMKNIYSFMVRHGKYTYANINMYNYLHTSTYSIYIVPPYIHTRDLTSQLYSWNAKLFSNTLVNEYFRCCCYSEKLSFYLN